ncbi:hypothetical protein Rs2_18630 [Raphanus sativus]|nr:hypothetical protein Rs2_18630 [Raphanus sativus]
MFFDCKGKLLDLKSLLCNACASFITSQAAARTNLTLWLGEELTRSLGTLMCLWVMICTTGKQLLWVRLIASPFAGGITPSNRADCDSVSNNGSWSGDSEDHKEKAAPSTATAKQETIPGTADKWIKLQRQLQMKKVGE